VGVRSKFGAREKRNTEFHDFGQKQKQKTNVKSKKQKVKSKKKKQNAKIENQNTRSKMQKAK
jgi:hypothetical protein